MEWEILGSVMSCSLMVNGMAQLQLSIEGMRGTAHDSFQLSCHHFICYGLRTVQFHPHHRAAFPHQHIQFIYITAPDAISSAPYGKEDVHPQSHFDFFYISRHFSNKSCWPCTTDPEDLPSHSAWSEYSTYTFSLQN